MAINVLSVSSMNSPSSILKRRSLESLPCGRARSFRETTTQMLQHHDLPLILETDYSFLEGKTTQ